VRDGESNPRKVVRQEMRRLPAYENCGRRR
jgi:hypothetical protein